MYKWIINGVIIILSVLILTFISSYAGLHFVVKDSIMTTLYTVSGIMFSIGLGLIVSFDLQGVKNPKYIRFIRKNIKRVRNSFISYFVTLTCLFVVIQSTNDNLILNKYFNLNLFVLILLLHSILYYVYNFLLIQNLKDDIFDKINHENQ